MSDFFENLQAGDEVILQDSQGRTFLKKVEKTTPTQIIVGSVRFRKQNGTEVGGGSWYFSSLHEPTEQLRKIAENEALMRKIAKKLSNVKVSRLSEDTLRKLDEIL